MVLVGNRPYQANPALLQFPLAQIAGHCNGTLRPGPTYILQPSYPARIGHMVIHLHQERRLAFKGENEKSFPCRQEIRQKQYFVIRTYRTIQYERQEVCCLHRLSHNAIAPEKFRLGESWICAFSIYFTHLALSNPEHISARKYT